MGSRAGILFLPFSYLSDLALLGLVKGLKQGQLKSLHFHFQRLLFGFHLAGGCLLHNFLPPPS